MAFVQQVIDGEPGELVVVGFLDGREVWRSTAPEAVPLEARLNIDYPEVEDCRAAAPEGRVIRWRMPDPEVFALLNPGAPETDREALRQVATSKGLDCSVEVAVRSGVKPGEASPAGRR